MKQSFNNNKNNKKKAFTLIELLVVIAIIGILSGAVIVAMSGTQESATDARIKAAMDQLRSSIEIYGLFHGSNYGSDYRGLDSDEEVSLLISDIESQAGVVSTIDISGSGNKYCLSTNLKSSDDKWCIDSSGFVGIGDYSNQVCYYGSSGGGSSWSCGNSFIDFRDSNIYPSVQIGTQCWMAKNLAYLPSVVGPRTGSETTPYYYVYGYDGTDVSAAKVNSNYTTYGVLYNWPAAMNGQTGEGVQGICPSGWHLPTDAEWNVLETYTVSVINSPNPQYPCSTSEYGWRRCADDSGTDAGGTYGAGKSLKKVGQGTGVGAGDDLVGFSALLAGYRYTNGSFYDLGSYPSFWSSSASSSSDAWSRDLYTSDSAVYRYNYNKAFGFSVRCLRD